MLAVIHWHSILFVVFAAVACAFAIAVAVTANVVRMAFYLVISLAATSGLFFLAGADFVGAMQLMIYVGGTLVLLIFGVMLTAQGPFISMKIRSGEWLVGAIVGGSLLWLLTAAAFKIDEWHTASSVPLPAVAPATASRLGMGLLGARVDRLDEKSPQSRSDMAGYLLPFEIISIHLLVVLVGSAYLARPKKRAVAGRQDVAGD